MMKKAMGFLFLLMLLSLGALAQADEILVGSEGAQTLTETVAQAQPGDVLRLPAGVYTQETELYPIVIDKPLTLVGAEGAVLESPPFTPLLRWGIVGLEDWLTVKDCTFPLYDDTYRVSSCGIWLAGAKHANLSGNSFTGCGVCLAGPPISESSQGKPVLTGLFEVGEDTAFFTSHTMEQNLVNGKPLYYLVGVEHMAVPADAGEIIVVDSSGVTISGADVSDCSMGLIVAYCNDVTVEGVRADRSGVFGTYFAYVDGAVMRNTSADQTNHALDFRASRELLLEQCAATDCD